MISQKYKFEGQIIDIQTKDPIAFANIYCANQPTIGTMSNSSGRFIFWADATCDLTISFVGYQTKQIIPKAGNNMVIAIEPTPFALEEVTVGAKEITGRGLILEAIEKLKENHAVEPMHFDIFNRVVMFDTDSTLHHIIEFSAEIFQNKLLATRYKMNKLRAGAYTNKGREDLKEHSFMASKKLDFDNILKYREDFLKRGKSKSYDYMLEGVTLVNKRKVFKIKFSTEKPSYYSTGYLFVDKETKAIVKKIILDNKNDKVLNEVGFKQIGAKWYQSYAYNYHQGYKTNKINERITLFTPKFENQVPREEFENIKMPESVLEFTNDLNVSYWDYETFVPLPDWILEQIKK
ncbi:carboxypeptidase-like regulatory domain-containing protein [Croceitalea dokdonensis]|nr:carboxypeptidase-like regulatory domain-containing protein [Croceitalea dokdonensis]